MHKIYFMREFLLYSLKAGDLGVCKVNLTKELEEACSGVECNSLVKHAPSGEKSIGPADC
jgi:hypothetical protein